MTNLVLFNGLKNAIKKIYKKYEKLIIKKMRKWYKNSKIFKKIIMKIGYWGSHGIEDKDGAQACESINAKLDGSGINNIFFKKVKN